MVRLRRYLEKKKLWSDREQKRAEEAAQAEVQRALEEAEAIPPPPVTSLFEDVFAEVPWHLAEERDELVAYLQSKGR